MLTFLRKIRRSLVKSGGTGRYLIYAVGEIALVVIGILIALQINNWNEERKERLLEDDYLEKIALNIKDDINQYHKILSAQEGYKNGMDSFLNIIRNPFSYETSELDQYYSQLWRFERFTPNKGALNNMISSGKINIIKNEELLNAILSYYKTIDEQTASVDEAISIYSRNQIGPYLMHFDFMDSNAIISKHRKRRSLLDYHQDPVMENLISARILMHGISTLR